MTLKVFSNVKLGPYDKDNCIGKGGMGKIYQVDENTVDKVNIILNLGKLTEEDEKGINDTSPKYSMHERLFTNKNIQHLDLKNPKIEKIYKAKKVEYCGDGVLKFDKIKIDFKPNYLMHAVSEFNSLYTLKGIEGIPNVSEGFTEPVLALDGAKNLVSVIRMNRIKGRNLAKLGASNLLAATDVAHVMIDLGNILMQTKYHGVVHRDIKPNNIISDIENGERKNTLIDFGTSYTNHKPIFISKGLETLIDERHVWEDGLAVGTPNYMSPEQIRGGEVSHTSDAFSLGQTLFLLFTGERAFPPYDPKENGEFIEVMVEIRNYKKSQDRLRLMDRFHNNFSKNDKHRRILAEGVEILLHENPHCRTVSDAVECAKIYLMLKYSKELF